MNQRRFLQISLGLVLLGAAIAAFWVLLAGGQGLLSALSRPLSGSIVVLPFLTGSWLLLRFIRWHFLLRSEGVRVPIRGSLAVYLASLLGTATPAYLGELIRSVLMRRRFGIPFRFTTAILIVERLLDVAAIGLIALFATEDWMLRMGLALGIGAVLIMLGDVYKRVSGASAAITGLLRRANRLAWAFFLSFGAWLVASLLVGFAARSIQVSLALGDGIRIFTTSTLIGGLTLMPAGMGATGGIAIVQLQGTGTALADAVVIVSLMRIMSTGLALSVGMVFLLFEVWSLRSSRAPDGRVHFDEIAGTYDRQFSEHVWDYLLQRKIGLITTTLPTPPARAGIGLDLGCGLGRQCQEMNRRGYRVVGIDPAFSILKQGSQDGMVAVNGDALRLPFAAGSFDFVYSIGVLHHLPGLQLQEAAFREVERILKPGGMFLIHETNPRNPLFRFYMSYVFPLLKTIDEGTEWWIDPQQWGKVGNLKMCGLRYFTFLPDFAPRFLMKPLIWFERRLERGPFGSLSVHYFATLCRTSSTV